MKTIRYEVIRRGDGEVALSANAGLVPFEPKLASVDREAKDTLLLVGDGPDQVVALAGVPEDVMVRQLRRGRVWFFEFAPHGLLAQHDLVLVKR